MKVDSQWPLTVHCTHKDENKVQAETPVSQNGKIFLISTFSDDKGIVENVNFFSNQSSFIIERPLSYTFMHNS